MASPSIMVDLSEDNCDVEVARTKLNRKRWKELKKYIAFTEYIAQHDPVKNANYVKLLQWIKTENEYPVYIANNIEKRIKMRYEKLKSTMVFPPHVVAAFTEVDAIVISDEEEGTMSIGDDINPGDSSHLSNLEETNKNRIEVANSTIDSGKRKKIQKKEKIKEGVVSLEKKSLLNSNTLTNEGIKDIEIISTNKKQSSTISGAKCDQNKEHIAFKARSPLRAPSEEGEILSDDGSSKNEMEVLKNNPKRRSHSIVLSEISQTNSHNSQTKGIDSFSSKTIETEDDAINQELFERIDSLANEANDLRDSRLLSWKDVEKEGEVQLEKSPILRNLDGDLFRRRSPNLPLRISLSPISDEDEFNNVSQKKKKKKHKHKKKESDWCVSEIENHSDKYEKDKTIKHKFFRINTGDNVKSQKKTSKKRKEKRKHCRALSISDDDEEVNSINTGQSDLPKTPEAKLFNRRDSTRKENRANKEDLNSDAVTVILLDSDEESDNTPPPAIVSKSGKKFIISTSPKLSPSSPPKALIPTPTSTSSPISIRSVPPPIVSVGASSSSKLMAEPIQKKDIPSSTGELQDIDNMCLQELNDIYTKLRETTGIPLEELLTELVNKSRTDMDQIPQINEKQLLNQNDLAPNISPNIYYNNNNVLSNKDDLNTNVLQQQQNRNYQHQQQYELQHQQLLQQQLEQGQQHQQQQSLQMQCPLNQIRCDLSMPYPYQNSLRLGLNLNDPRIMRQLKQIKDSPIHNLNIRESASYLMNSYTSGPQNRSNPIAEVTSKTAKTYGEHKRLRELEKQKALERQNAKRCIVVTNDTQETQNIASSQADNMQSDHSSRSAVTTQKSSKAMRKNSSGSESSRRAPKSSDDEEERTIMSFSINPRARLCIESSPSSESSVSFENHTPSKENISSGRMTPFEVEKVLGIVLPAMGKTKESAGKTLESLYKSKSPSKSRKNSTRQSTESDGGTLGSLPRSSSKSRRNSSRHSTDSTKSDGKSQKSKHDTDKTAQNSTDNITTNNSASKNDKEYDHLINSVEKSPKSINSFRAGKKKSKGRPKTTPQQKKHDQTSVKTKNCQQKRGNRELNNLNCTFKDFKEIFEKNYIPTTDGKRRCCNVPTGSMMEHQSNSSDVSQNSEDHLDDTSNNSDVLFSSRQDVRAAPIQRRRQTCSALPRKELPEKNTLPPVKLKIRRLSESGRLGVDKGIEVSSSYDTDEFDIEEHRKVIVNQVPIEQQPMVKLRKLPFSDIKKSLKLTDDMLQTNNYDLALNSSKSILKSLPPKECNTDRENHAKQPSVSPEAGLLVESTHEIPILVPFTSKPVDIPSKHIPKSSRRLNVDINMTLTSTKVCAICNKRPKELTNHYVVQHKSESYISRLTSAEIKNLEENITIALPYRKRFKVTCAFCQDELEDHFVNFHAHFSFHTGEYGFRCDVCEIVMPYREDIRSHQYRSSRCRNVKIRTNYLYNPDLTVIYLYVCKLCNFVQLNEANIHKHHRDHHGFRFDEPQYVKKCIIAAVDNTEVINEVLSTNLEGVNPKEDEIPTDGNPVIREQEFVHECPLDIKDVLLTQENQASQSIKQNHAIESTERNKCTPENQSTQENHLVPQQPNLSDGIKAIKQETSTISSDQTSLQSLLKDINIGNQLVDSKSAPSPEALLAQLHAPPSDNIMTVIHCAEAKTCQENHQPYIESEDKKPDIKDIKIESLVDTKPRQSKTLMNYRQINSNSTYFGLYKCMLDKCWFSTNVAEKFIQHTKLHTSKKPNISLRCAYCRVRISCVEILVLHIRSRHSTSRYQCSQCSYRSIMPGNVSIHRSICHKNSNADIYECAGRYRSVEERLIVMKEKMIGNLTSLKCPDCSSTFYAISSIKLHIQTFHPLSSDKLDTMIFNNFACIYCKDESNSMISMQEHLATHHPHEMCFVAERKLKSGAYLDAVENLNMINICTPISPEDIRSYIEESENLNCEFSNPEDADTDMQPALEESSQVDTRKSAENTSVQIATKEEQLVLMCIKPLLDLVASHFESHSRHEYICFHCIKSFYAREKIGEHFALSHKDCQSFIEKEISFDSKSYYIVKKQDVPILDWVPVLKNFAEAIRINWIERLKNTNFEWWEGLASSCLEEIEIPQYITIGQHRYKCLLKHCPFVGLDEDTLDLHLNEHTLPSNYKCSHCAVNISTPNWENMKNHKMLHRNDLYICCVCKFFHHNRSGITKHIDSFHNSRDVPVISLWRDETNYKTSLSIVLPPGKTGFTTSVACFCCRKDMKNSTKLIRHLRIEHNITLCQKCELCDKILLTQIEAEAHTKEHGIEIFKLKYDVLATFLYKLTIKSLYPFSIEMKPSKEKRAHEVIEASTLKRTKLNDELPVTVNEEVVIKTEQEEDVVLEDAATFLKPEGSLKCVNIEQLVVRDPARTSYMPETVNLLQKGSIYIKSTAELQATGPPITVNVSQYQQHQGRSHVARINPTCVNNEQNSPVIQPYPISLIQPTSVMQYTPPVLPPQQHATSGQIIMKIPLLNNQGMAVVSQPAKQYIVSNAGVPGILHTRTHPGYNHSKAQYSHQNEKSTVLATMLQPTLSATAAPSTLQTQIREGINHSINYVQHTDRRTISTAMVHPNNNHSEARYAPQNIQPIASTTMARSNSQERIRPGINHYKNNAQQNKQRTVPTTMVRSNIHHSEAYTPQNVQPTASTTIAPSIVQAQIRSGINHSEPHFLQQNAQSSLNLVVSQNKVHRPYDDPIVPEILPICENCKMECVDFSHLRLHFEEVHAPKGARFLFRISRRVECVHCSFRGGLGSLPAHYTTFHPDKPRLCRSVIDFNRCGVCHENFSIQPSSNSPLVPKCACPMRQRVLSDCLDLKTLNVIQNFGKEFYAYVCELCKRSFHYQRECSQHILNVHHRSDIIPGQWLIKSLLYVCDSCEKTARTIKEVIEHIRNSHLVDTVMGTLGDRMTHYNKIGVIYPMGLIVYISELRNTGSFDEESFKRDVQCVEAQYDGSVVK